MAATPPTTHRELTTIRHSAPDHNPIASTHCAVLKQIQPRSQSEPWTSRHLLGLEHQRLCKASLPTAGGGPTQLVGGLTTCTKRAIVRNVHPLLYVVDMRQNCCACVLLVQFLFISHSHAGLCAQRVVVARVCQETRALGRCEWCVSNRG